MDLETDVSGDTQTLMDFRCHLYGNIFVGLKKRIGAYSLNCGIPVLITRFATRAVNLFPEKVRYVVERAASE